MCSGTSNNDLFADFQLLIVKICEFFPQKFQHKNARPILAFRSGIRRGSGISISSGGRGWGILTKYVNRPMPRFTVIVNPSFE